MIYQQVGANNSSVFVNSLVVSITGEMYKLLHNNMFVSHEWSE